jgi:hypothetical protein
MSRAAIVLAACFALSACDDSSKPSPQAEAEQKAAKEDADRKERLAERAKEREAKAEAEKQAEEDLKQKVQEVTVIPEGTKLPKKPTQACDQVGEAQLNFMKKFHPEVPESALTTQIGMIKKQCNEMKKIPVAMCQKFALDATTDELKGAINDYLPACMEKYGQEDANAK